LVDLRVGNVSENPTILKPVYDSLEMVVLVLANQVQTPCFFFQQIMFEDYQFDGVYIGIQPILTLYAKGQMQKSSLSLLSHILVFMYIWKLNTMRTTY